MKVRLVVKVWYKAIDGLFSGQKPKSFRKPQLRLLTFSGSGHQVRIQVPDELEENFNIIGRHHRCRRCRNIRFSPGIWHCC